MATIKEGDKVRIHCPSKKLYDNRVGKVLHIWDLDTNPWGNVVVMIEDDYCENCFLEEELELLEEEKCNTYMETSVNNKCRAFTSLEQSKKLAEILPLESADMYYDRGGLPSLIDKYVTYESIKNDKYHHLIPCWSLPALLGVLPQSITKYVESERCQKTFHLNLFRSYYCCVSYDKIPSVNDDNSLYCIGRDNWIDACYEMILKLNELKML